MKHLLGEFQSKPCSMLRWFMLLTLLLVACGADPLQGHAAKGPLILGSAVSVAGLDDTAEPTGQVWQTEITDDLGTFSLSAVEAGPIRIEATGYAFDEVRGTLTSAPLTLRAIGEAGVSATVEVNTLTHLAAPRTAALMADGSSAEDAALQAESELRESLGFAPDGFDAGPKGVELSLTGGDTDGNAWLLAVSAVLAQAAVDEAGEDSIDAALQELLNGLASDLADDGAFAEAHSAGLAQAAAALDSDAVITQLGERFDDLGFVGEVPDLRRALDRDGDGTADADDTDADGDGETSAEAGGNDCYDEDASALGCGPLGEVVIDDVLTQRIIGTKQDTNFGSPLAALGDLDGDGVMDFALGGEGTRFYTGGDTETPATLTHTLTGAWSSAAPAGDTDGDGVQEILLGRVTYEDMAGQVRLVPYPLDTTDPELLVGPNLVGSDSWSYLNRPVGLGDSDGDGADDIAVAEVRANVGCEGCGAVWAYLGPLSDEPTPADASASVLAEDETAWLEVHGPGDLDGDGLGDLAVSDHTDCDSCSDRTGGVYVFSGGLAVELGLDDADATLTGGQGSKLTLFLADDLDGDGTTDLVGKASQAGGTTSDPWLAVWSGPFAGTSTVSSATATVGLSDYVEMDNVASAGPSDADGDGQADLWVGARIDHTGSDAGAAYLFYGPHTGSLTFDAADARISGTVVTEYVGLRLAAPGDLDQDGHEDLLVWRQPGYVPEVDIILGGAWE